METLHKAMFWHNTTESVIKCELCPHHCILRNGQRGICRSRINYNGILYAESYGKACALAIDPVEKKPLYHFMPGSKCLSIAATGCNLHCKNCQNHEISQAKPGEIPYQYITPEKFAETALQRNCPSVAYTYTEPLTWFEYLYDCCTAARKKGLKNILVSAGYIDQEPLKMLCPYIDAANIDLKTFNNDVYIKQNGGKLQPVLDTLLTMKSSNIWLEITNLIIPGINDDTKTIEDMCKWLYKNGFGNTPLHFSKFFPCYKQTDINPTPLETLNKARDIALFNKIKYVYLGNIP